MPRCSSDDCTRWRPELLARRMAGVTIDGRWFCSQACVERMARRLLESRAYPAGLPAVPPLRLGVLLRYYGAITSDQLHASLAAQPESRLRLGAQLVALAYAEPEDIERVITSPQLIRYNEHTVVDPNVLRVQLRQIREQGMTILLVEQNALAALDVADRAYVLESGLIKQTGKAADLAQSDEVRKAYLGG